MAPWASKTLPIYAHPVDFKINEYVSKVTRNAEEVRKLVELAFNMFAPHQMVSWFLGDENNRKDAAESDGNGMDDAAGRI